MPKKVKNNKKRSIQIKNKNKNSIHININSNNKRRGTSSGGQRQQSSHPTIIMSAPHVPYIPTDSGTSNLYPILSDIKERLAIQAKQPQQVKEFVGVNEPEPITVYKNPSSSADNSLKRNIETVGRNFFNTLDNLNKPKRGDKRGGYTSDSSSSNEFPIDTRLETLRNEAPSPYTPIKTLDNRPRIPNPSGKGIPILVGGPTYNKYLKAGIIKDIR